MRIKRFPGHSEYAPIRFASVIHRMQEAGARAKPKYIATLERHAGKHAASTAVRLVPRKITKPLS